jgi:hypothetical protein
VQSVSFNECAPETHWGEISKLYVGPADLAAFLDVSALSEWTAKLADTGDDKIRTLIVIGEQPEPEQTEVSISGDRVVVGYKKFIVNAEIDETNETNYNFLAMSECGGKYLMWYETSDGILYGGNEGIEVSLKMNQVIPKERTGIVKIMVKASWNSLQHPYRCVSPMA